MRTQRPLPALLAALAMVLGCSPLLTVDGGYFDTLSDRPGRTGAAVNLRVGVYNPQSPPASGPTLGATAGLRTKFSERLTQVALAEDFVLIPFAQIEWLTPFLRGGMNAYQFESLDDEFAYGMFSPYAEGGVLVRLWRDVDGGCVFLSLAGAVEYDLRFTDQPNEGYWMGIAGIGLGGSPWEPPPKSP